MKLEGHEALTNVGMKAFKKLVDAQIEDLKAQVEGQEGAGRSQAKERIDRLEGTLAGIVAGARWNDLLHNAGIVQLGLSLIIAGAGGRESSLAYASHEGHLQFLHSMAASAAEPAWQTRHKILLWAEFCYRVSTGEIPTTAHLNQVDPYLSVEKDLHSGPTFAEMFRPWKDHSVGWLFSGSKTQSSDSRTRGMAVGSLLHVLQDSFCMSHTQRLAAKRTAEKARAIRGFNVYPEQSANPLWGTHARADIMQGGRLTSQEERVAMTAGAQEAVEATAGMLDLYSRMAGWDEVKEYLQGILGLAPELEAQKPADKNWHSSPATDPLTEQDERGQRITSAAGRLFRKHIILDIFKKTFGRFSLLEPRAINRLRRSLRAYNAELNKQLKTLTVKISLDQLYENFLLPQVSALSLAILADEEAVPFIHSDKKWMHKRDTKRAALIQVLDEIKTMLEEDMAEIQTDIQAIRETQNEETCPSSYFLL